MHCAGHNYQLNIRQAVLYDYIKRAELLDDGPPPADMWQDWSDMLRSAAVDQESKQSMIAPLWWNDPREKELSPRSRPAPKL